MQAGSNRYETLKDRVQSPGADLGGKANAKIIYLELSHVAYQIKADDA